MRHTRCIHDKAQRKTSAASHAEIFVDAPMQLKYVPASRLLVQPVDILRDECRQFARLLHLRQTPMDDIGLGPADKSCVYDKNHRKYPDAERKTNG